ncbi:thioesterase II family protein [Stigmatella aurantiaca]|uniref:Linear gramicidin dehydrogenase LgrE n=1 Tax=Stigmatella aurantiaca (strain DW4/3-1) TaxID=378806 RepID=Q08PI5_STIAD|nr:alpha/beta fold hydrolase [Stigmatella aurantiaca]ADO72604.1 thioesterase [Stigmatella aurantiaca DW4/3-1]EAU62393.1 linear gramicidin dehydrogenase LgrE [Stigmatella aurantiaca DW4/3-1]CAQ34930.1 TPA: type II thioesterase [Stigmatella aurantiaca DW4/3-1]
MKPDSSPPPINSPWLVQRKPPTSSGVRLFCFPYAGAGSLPYFKWPDLLPGGIDLCAVQLPGRENRLREPALRDLHQLITKLVEALSPHLGGEFAFFGHSFGALVAFELIRELRRRGLPLPKVLFASGSESPSLRTKLPALSGLERDDFVREVAARYGGLPRHIMEQRELLDLVLPTLRADLKILEDYVYRPEPPLPLRICAFGGTEDPRVAEAALDAWRRETNVAFKLQIFPGGHFFINEVTRQVLQTLSNELIAGSHPSP